MQTIGSLFSGIGGLELGLEWSGLGKVAWQVEKEPFARRVLAKHWPDVGRFEDVCTVGKHCLEPVDIICGGFPCQDISFAGKGAGIAGERSGLWREYARLVRELGPRLVIVENVSALRTRGLETVLRDLAALGYDAWWDCIPASAVGAPHRRDRLFIVARFVGNTNNEGLERRRLQGREHSDQRIVGAPSGEMANTDGSRQPQPQGVIGREWRWALDGDQELANTDGQRERESKHETVPKSRDIARESPSQRSRWIAQPSVGGTSDGFSAWLDKGFPAGPDETQHGWEAPRTTLACPNRPARLKALGNAVVPQVGYLIGKISQTIDARYQ